MDDKLKKSLRVNVVFTHRPSDEATWPYKGYDYESRKKELMRKLKHRHSDIDFEVSSVKSEDDVKEVLDQKEKFDAFLIYMIGLWTGAPVRIAESGKPTLLVDDLYGGSGEFLMSYSVAKEKGKVAGTASSSFEDVSDLLSLLKAVKRMKESKILVIKQEEPDFEEYSSRIKKLFGTEIIEMKPEKIENYKEKTSDRKAEELAEKWMEKSKNIVEPSYEDLIDSAKFYLALLKAMKEKDVDAVTVDCLNSYNRKLLGYPCLAFFQLNNDGSAGICEADLNSSVTMLLGQYMTEELIGEPRPGYVSDPVIDLNAGRIIYAHCVATNKVFGPSGPENPYIIRSHAEDNEGASIQSLMPVEEDVTTLIIDVMNKTMRLHQGYTVGNVQEEKGCRTKLSVKADVENILENWKRCGWHRVTFYGKWKNQMKKLASLIGLEVIEEDQFPLKK